MYQWLARVEGLVIGSREGLLYCLILFVLYEKQSQSSFRESGNLELVEIVDSGSR